MLAVVQTGAWHLAFPGSLMEEMRGNPQNRTDLQVRTVNYRKQAGVVYTKESMRVVVVGKYSRKGHRAKNVLSP